MAKNASETEHAILRLLAGVAGGHVSVGTAAAAVVTLDANVPTSLTITGATNAAGTDIDPSNLETDRNLDALDGRPILLDTSAVTGIDSTATLSWDGAVIDAGLYLAWFQTAGWQVVRIDDEGFEQIFVIAGWAAGVLTVTKAVHKRKPFMVMVWEDKGGGVYVKAKVETEILANGDVNIYDATEAGFDGKIDIL